MYLQVRCMVVHVIGGSVHKKNNIPKLVFQSLAWSLLSDTENNILFSSIQLSNVFLFVVALHDGERLTDEERLLDELFSGYNPSARPVLNSSDTVSVSIQFSLMHIKELVMHSIKIITHLNIILNINSITYYVLQDVISQIFTTTGLLILVSVWMVINYAHFFLHRTQKVWEHFINGTYYKTYMLLKELEKIVSVVIIHCVDLYIDCNISCFCYAMFIISYLLFCNALECDPVHLVHTF